MKKRIIVASACHAGSLYTLRMLEVLSALDVEVHLLISDDVEAAIEKETGDHHKHTIESLSQLCTERYKVESLSLQGSSFAICSGRFAFDALCIVPCRATTIGEIANGIATNTITRVAQIALKQRHRMILMPRETPMSMILLEQMHKLASAGVDIVPPCAYEWFYGPKSPQDMVDITVGKCLDLLGFEHQLFKCVGK